MAKVADVTIKVNSNKQAILDEFRQQKKVALEAIGLQGETNAKMHITAVGAVASGILRNSISHDTDDDSAYIGTDVEYGVYVELGTGIYASEGGRSTPWVYKDDEGNWHTTVGMKPRPYLAPAVQEHIDEYKELVENYMKKD